MHVLKETMTGSVSICDETKSGAAGSMQCDVSAQQGEVLVRVYSSASTETPLISKWFSLTFTDKLSNIISSYEGALWAFGITLTIAATGLFSPAGAVIATIMGLIAVFFLNILNAITLTFIILACVMGIVIGIKMRN
jgi:hypothetical protein